MKKPHFLCIAPYEGMRELFINYANLQPDIICTVLSGDQTEGVRLAAEYMSDDIDGIISRGETATLLANAFSKPIFSIHFSIYDLLRAIKSAQSITDRFVVVGKSHITKNVQLLCNLLQYPDIRIETISDISETESVLLRCKELGYTLAVGDFNTGKQAKQLNMQNILIMSGLESIEEAFQRAIWSVNSIRTYREQEELIKSIHAVLPQQIAIFDNNQQLLYTSLDEKQLTFLPLIEENIATCHEHHFVELVEKDSETQYNIHGKRLFANQQNYYLFYIETKKLPPALRAVTIHNTSAADQTDNYLMWGHGNKITDFIKQAEHYAQLSYPLFIAGEYGTEIDQLVPHLYRHCKQKNSPMIEIDCNLLSKSDWLSFFDHHVSPLYTTNAVLYIKSIETLSSDQIDKLFLYLDHSNAFKRNKVFLSYQYISHQTFSKFCKTYPHYLISYVTLTVPPLREHTEDIWEISNLYLNVLNMEYGKQVIGLQSTAAEQLEAFPWPQNIDQLKHVLRAALIASTSPYISRHELEFILSNMAPPSVAAEQKGYAQIDYSLTLREINHQIAEYILRLENMNQSRAAKRLNISRSTLWRILNE